MERPTTQPSSPPGTSAARDAGSAIAALSRVTRSFVLYDAENAVVRQLLADYGAKMRAALDARGALVLEVRGYELLAGGEVVYHDRDREKSLAFRLYRDGIRRLTLTREVGWDELVRLVEIVAVRCTALRSTEEDLVTLLRKAELRGVHVDAVEGFVPAEEAPEPAAPAAGEAALRGAPAELAREWDMPLQKLPAPGPLEYRAIDDAALATLAAASLPDVDAVALSVVEELLDASHRAGWPVPNADLSAFLAELRDALLADGRLDTLKRLVDVVRRAGGEELREETLRGLGDARALALVLAATPAGETALPRELSALLPLVGVDAVLDRLAGEASEARRTLLCEIVAARLPRAADAVVPRLGRLPAGVASALARAVVDRAPERALEVARELLAQADEAYRLEGLAALDAAPRVPLHALCELLRDRSAAVRARAAEVLGHRGDESAAEPLRAAIEDGASGPSLDEADALGRALAEVAPVAAERLFEGWIAPRARFLRRPTARERALQRAAVAGYGALPGPAAEAALRALAERAEGDLRRHLLATLARRRKALHAHG